jgi:Lon protease-like protein
MTKVIPIFPLAVIVYPGQSVNLHIFEPRYRQLIEDSVAKNKPFGIPAVIRNELKDMGTLVEVTAIRQTYEDGKMDISTRGLKVFRVLEFIKEIPDKLYNGAIVTYPDNISDGKPARMEKIIAGMKELHQLLQVSKDLKKPVSEWNAYDIAPHLGLTPDEELELLSLLKESQRQEYLTRHLKKVLPVLSKMESLKEKIRMNGHFRSLDSFQFE